MVTGFGMGVEDAVCVVRAGRVGPADNGAAVTTKMPSKTGTGTSTCSGGAGGGVTMMVGCGAGSTN